MVSATCSHPCAGGPKGLARVTSPRWENSFFVGELRGLIMDGGRLRVETDEAYAISLTGGGDRWQWGSERHGGVGVPITEAEFDLAPFRSSYCRVTVVDQAGRRAWSNPLWP
jgi:hypothetical protein